MDKKKILMIDDEEAICILVKLNLESAGEYEVTIATSGNEGLAKAKETDFDLVITDLLMPGISGRDVLRAIKAMKPDMPVILASAFHDVNDLGNSPDLAAADAYIKKPFDRVEINKAVKRVLDGRKT